MLAVEAGLAAVMAAVLSSWIAARRPSWIRTPLDLPMALFAAGGILFYWLSPERGASSLELTRILFSAAAFFTASQTIPRLRAPERVTAFWGVTAGLLGLYTLLQVRGGVWILMVPKLERPIATFGNPIFLAAYLSASLVALIGLAASTPAGAPRGKLRPLLWLCAALAAAGLLATQTRAALAGLGAAAGLAVVLVLPGRRRWLAMGAVVALLALAAWGFRGRQWTHGLIWKDTLSLWLAHPWLGCGLGRFHIEFPAHASEALRALWPERKVIINFAHNEYLQVLAETGIVGFALLAGVFVTALLWLARTWKRTAGRARMDLHAGGLAFAAIALLAQNVFSPDIRFGVSSFVVFFCLGAATGGGGRQVPLPAFPGRFGCAAAGAAFLFVWGRMAVQPMLAYRRLSREPGFHVQSSGQLGKALRDLEAKLVAHPDDADIAENLAYLYAKKKSWPQAISRFEVAARLAPERPGPLNNLGNIHYSLGDREKAIVHWQRSLVIDPGQIDAHLNLGKALYEVGRLKGSAEHIQHVLEREPANEKAQILLKKMIE
ncbi:MAG: tetratricopeptide repeat protein [Elusimicrobiota bacterium]